jgi:thiol:disulfide interchange protein DsbG
MKKNMIVTALAAVVLSMASSAFAATAQPKPIEMAVHAGMKVVQQFNAASGLKGWVLSQGGQYSIVYTTADAQTLIAGALIDGQGKNLTAEYGAKYIPKPDYTAAYPKLEQSSYIASKTANPKSTIYVIIDPNCIFCHLVWKAFKPYQAAGLQIKWVPVGFLKPTSQGIAAAILTAKDPAAAFEENESKFDASKEAGGVAPMANVPADIAAKLNANNALMGAFGSHGTPTIVWKDAAGQVHTKDGMPRLSELPGITGLPDQAETDPELARFK